MYGNLPWYIEQFLIWVSQRLASLMILLPFLIVVGIAILVVTYVYFSAIIVSMGHKAGIAKSENWKAYAPFVRTVYKASPGGRCFSWTTSCTA